MVYCVNIIKISRYLLETVLVRLPITIEICLNVSGSYHSQLRLNYETIQGQ